MKNNFEGRNMSFRIVADSACDKTELLNQLNNITFVPLTLEIGNYRIMDDENFDQDDFVKRVEEYDGTPKTACPSPDAWAQAFDCDEEDIYVITITDKLSGTYNSALQGAELFQEEHPEAKKNIHVFNSLATSGQESLIAEEIVALGEQGLGFDEIVEKIESFIINGVELDFVLNSLDALKNNGRLYAVATSILSKIKIKFLFKAADGNLSYLAQDFTMSRALLKLASHVVDNMQGKDASEKHLVITHVCCEDKAQLVADKIAAKGVNFGKVEIVKCGGLNTTYATNGSVLVAYTK